MLSDDADRETIRIIRAARPDILLVAFGAPKQEKWISKYMETLQVPVLIGVGGSFDMLSGRVSRAPMWMQRTGLEWFFRFLAEPGRLWKRYFLDDLPTFLRLMEGAGTVDAPLVSVQFDAPERVVAREGTGVPAA